MYSLITRFKWIKKLAVQRKKRFCKLQNECKSKRLTEKFYSSFKALTSWIDVKQKYDNVIGKAKIIRVPITPSALSQSALSRGHRHSSIKFIMDDLFFSFLPSVFIKEKFLISFSDFNWTLYPLATTTADYHNTSIFLVAFAFFSFSPLRSP